MNSQRLNVSKKQPILAPSILSAKFSCLKDEIHDVEQAGVDWLHVDIMDGHFVPNLTFGPWIVEELKTITKLPLDCHLMVSHPEDWIPYFAQAGAQCITIHAEATCHLDRHLNHIRELGIQAGVAINPSSPLSLIENVLECVDLVLIMSVNPGFGGQKFIKNSLSKIQRLVQMRGDRDFLIEVDGGVHSGNILSLRNAGVDVFVAGSAVFSASDRRSAIADLRHAIDAGG